MAKSMYKYIGDFWHQSEKTGHKLVNRARLITWRREEVFTRVDKPLRLDRARSLGYKAKQGIVMVRTRVRRGGLRVRHIAKGRKPTGKGIASITMAKSIQRIAEERTATHFPNMEVLNSYYVGQDGKHKFYEVILVDPHHAVIKSDPHLAWMSNGKNSGRVYRGLTSAGKRGRGHYHKGRGAEKLRPSIRAHLSKGK